MRTPELTPRNSPKLRTSYGHTRIVLLECKGIYVVRREKDGCKGCLFFDDENISCKAEMPGATSKEYIEIHQACNPVNDNSRAYILTAMPDFGEWLFITSVLAEQIKNLCPDSTMAKKILSNANAIYDLISVLNAASEAPIKIGEKAVSARKLQIPGGT